MSAIFGRILLTVGIGVVSAVIYTFFKQREQHGHYQEQRRIPGDDYGGGGGGGDWGVPPSWRDTAGDDDEAERRLRRFKRKKREREALESSTSRTSEQEQGGSDATGPSSIQKGCFICLEAFEDLKRRGIPIWCTPCGHLFCKPCLERAIGINRACPSCRKSVNFGNCHKVHL